jgi:DNA-binding Lrp family transcriptional regulator
VRALEEEAGVPTGYAAVVDKERYGLPFYVFVSISPESQRDEALAEPSRRWRGVQLSQRLRRR